MISGHPHVNRNPQQWKITVLFRLDTLASNLWMLTLSTLSNFNELSYSLFWIELNRSVGLKGLIVQLVWLLNVCLIAVFDIPRTAIWRRYTTIHIWNITNDRRFFLCSKQKVCTIRWVSMLVVIYVIMSEILYKGDPS